MTKLTWDDLLIETPEEDPSTLLEEWRWLLSGEFRPLTWSKFGDCFVERRSGAVEHLDILAGELRKVADSTAEFYERINTRKIQEEWLLSFLIFQMHERGVVPDATECYALKIHPVLGGKIEPDNVIIMGLRVWSSISGQLYRQLQGKPRDFVISRFQLKHER